MNKTNQRVYLAPEVEVIKIEVERGYFASDNLSRIGFGDCGEAGGEIETITQIGW